MPKNNYNEDDENRFFEIGIRKLDSGDIKGAISSFKKAIRINPKSQKLYNTLGIAYELSKNYELARKSYEKALEIKPSDAAVINNIGGLSVTEGNLEDAASMFDKSILTDPLYIEPYMNMARMYIEMVKYTDAEPYLKKVLEI